jgi:hypothetical protein
MMHALSAQEILRIWEVGSGQHPVDRALTILATAFPQLPRESLVALSVGQRDGYLLDVRKWTFGTQLVCFTECLKCCERLEFELDVTDIQVEQSEAYPVPTEVYRTYTVQSEEYELRFRLPTSLDLSAIAVCSDIGVARDLLLQRCLLQVTTDNVEVDVKAVPETAIATLAAQMGKRDPQAEVQIDLACPACDYRWPVLFDIVAFLWKEICVQAKRLLREIHRLAWAYGWREADILSLSPARRQFYLEMVTNG